MCSRHDGYGSLTNPTMFRYAMLGVHRSPSQRGRGFGNVLAKSYLHYALAKLGYKATVFIFVHAINEARIRPV